MASLVNRWSIAISLACVLAALAVYFVCCGILCVDRSGESLLYMKVYDSLLVVSQVKPALSCETAQVLMDALLKDAMYDYWKKEHVAYKLRIVSLNGRDTTFDWIYSGEDGWFRTGDDVSERYTLREFGETKHVPYTNTYTKMPPLEFE